MKRVSITVYGKVQGVFFRQSTKDKADELALTGLVQNDPDGSVYMEIQGFQDAIDEMKEWVKTGPPGAVVERTVLHDMRVDDEEDEFVINRF